MNLKSLLLAAVMAAIFFAAPAVQAEHHQDPHSGSVMNYHRIDDRLVTGGHFVRDDLPVPRGYG